MSDTDEDDGFTCSGCGEEKSVSPSLVITGGFIHKGIDRIPVNGRFCDDCFDIPEYRKVGL